MTQLFTKTSKTVPADETSKNAQLLIQAGYIHKEMAGVYSYLPLGLKVLNNIVEIIRDEMNKAGGSEISLSALQSKEVWEASGRWSDDVMDVWFRTELANGSILGLAPTHEEPLTNLMRRFISSYKDLPAYPYQFQVKFRNELRSKSGLMRGREFLMKDLYSFSRDEIEHQAFYDKMSDSYLAVYRRLGLGDITYKTFASGGSFSRFSHEFQTLSPVGEDTIYVHKAKRLAINKEVYTDEVLADLGVDKNDLTEERAVEVGNIFTLGTKYSSALGLNYTDEEGREKPVFMGSYGIGPSRVMGLIAEHFSDERGLNWPEAIAPAQVYLARLGDSPSVVKSADSLYSHLTKNNIEVIYDDRNKRAGEKLSDSELLGIPYRLVVSDKTVKQNRFEFKSRIGDEAELVSESDLLSKIKVKL
jgi:prolyl-tRNA synthetase